MRLMIKKRNGQKKGSLVAAENKKRGRIKRTREIYSLAQKELGLLSHRDKFILRIALYAAEGDKKDRKVGFTNSDPKIIYFMMKWFRIYTKIQMSKMRRAIWLHEDLDEKNAKIFWSRLTGIPLDQFHKTYVAKVKNNSRKIRKNIHNYGIFAIRFTSASVHRKIMGWIYALFNDKIDSYSVVAQW